MTVTVSEIEIEIETEAVCVSAQANVIAKEGGGCCLGRWMAVLAVLAAREG